MWDRRLVPVSRVLEFRHAVQRWDAEAALRAASELRMAADLLDGDELRDGAVVMALRAGNRPLAQEWFGFLAEATARPEGDLRNLLLETRVASVADDSARGAP